MKQFIFAVPRWGRKVLLAPLQDRCRSAFSLSGACLPHSKRRVFCFWPARGRATVETRPFSFTIKVSPECRGLCLMYLYLRVFYMIGTAAGRKGKGKWERNKGWGEMSKEREWKMKASRLFSCHEKPLVKMLMWATCYSSKVASAVWCINGNSSQMELHWLKNPFVQMMCFVWRN